MAFIEDIAKYVQKYAPQYNIIVYSPIIAQAILESGLGTSELAKNANNYFGLKYNPNQPNRCPSANGYYIKVGSEQNADGSYTSSTMLWQKFPNMEAGVKGYFDFLHYSSRYNNLQNISNPQTYLENIKADGYATSLSYVQNLMNVINKYNLTQYDKKEDTKPMGYKNSPLVCYTKISPNKTSPRNHVIDTITIHCMAGNLTVESCGNVFAPTSRQASSNYGIGSDGRIGLYVEEKDRSWCSSNSANDHRAITIEVANDGGAPDWHVSDKAMASLLALCADICKRNNIKELKWQGDKNLIGQIDKQNMTVHRWFAAKACPGDYLYNKHGYIASEVNKILGGDTSPVTPQPSPVTPAPTSAVLVNGQVIKLQPGCTYANGKTIPSWVFNSTLYYRGMSGENVIFSTQKTGAITGTVKPENVINPNAPVSSSYIVQVTTDVLNIRKGPGTNYAITGSIKDRGKYTIVAEQNGFGKLKSGAGWISLNYTKKC